MYFTYGNRILTISYCDSRSGDLSQKSYRDKSARLFISINWLKFAKYVNCISVNGGLHMWGPVARSRVLVGCNCGSGGAENCTAIRELRGVNSTSSEKAPCNVHHTVSYHPKSYNHNLILPISRSNCVNMADPLSLIASIAGLIAFGIKVHEIGCATLTPHRQTSAQLQSLNIELESLTAILQNLHSVLTNSPTSISAVAGPSVANLMRVLDETMTLLLTAHGLFINYGRDFSARWSWKTPIKRMGWASKEKRIDELLKRVDVFKATIHLALQVATYAQASKIQGAAERTEDIAHLVATDLQKVRALLRQVAGHTGVSELGSEVGYPTTTHQLQRWISSLESTYETLSEVSCELESSSSHQPAISEIPYTTSERDIIPETSPLVTSARTDGKKNISGHTTNLAVITATPTVDPPITSVNMQNAALMYLEQGRFQDAEELLLQVMEKQKGIDGCENPAALANMHNLAFAYREQNKLKEAEELFVKVVEKQKSLLGFEHERVLTALHDLAFTYVYQGRFQDAEELYDQVVEKRKRVLGPEDADTLLSMHNLAFAYKEHGRLQEAEELFVEVVRKQKRVLGSEHQEVLTTLHNLAVTYREQEKWKEAEKVFYEVVEAQKRLLGHKHAHTLISMRYLASVYRLQGKLKEAGNLYLELSRWSASGEMLEAVEVSSSQISDDNLC